SNLPHIAHRHGQVLCEAAVAIHADDLHLAADVPLPSAAEVAMPATNVTFGRDLLPRRKAFHALADRFDHAHELVPYDQRRMDAPLRPLVPFVYMKVGAADPGLLDANENFVAFADRTLFGLEPDAWRPALLHQRRHCLLARHPRRPWYNNSNDRTSHVRVAD